MLRQDLIIEFSVTRIYVPPNTQTLLYTATHAPCNILCQVHTENQNFLSLLNTHANLSWSVWHVVPYFHTHIPVQRFSSPASCVPLLLLDLLFSLVRVRLMPMSMLIVHCSKAAFIKMIKHSQTTAKYLKASGRGTWQVTTSHTNSPTSSPPDLPSHSRLDIYHA